MCDSNPSAHTTERHASFSSRLHLLLIIHYSYHEISSLVILIMLIISYFFGSSWELSSHTPQKHLKWRTNCSGVCSLTWSLSVCITSYFSPCFVYINVVWTENRTRIKMQQCTIFFLPLGMDQNVPNYRCENTPRLQGTRKLYFLLQEDTDRRSLQ